MKVINEHPGDPIDRIFQPYEKGDGFETFGNVWDQGMVTMKYEDLDMERCLST